MPDRKTAPAPVAPYTAAVRSEPPYIPFADLPPKARSIHVLRQYALNGFTARERRFIEKWLDEALRPMVRKLARKFVQRSDQVEDVAQPVLALVLTEARKCRALLDPSLAGQEYRVWAWIRSVARSHALDALRGPAHVSLSDVDDDAMPVAVPGVQGMHVDAVERALRAAWEAILLVVAGVVGTAADRQRVREADVGADVPSVQRHLEAWYQVRCEGAPTDTASPEPGDDTVPRKMIQDRTSQRVARGARAITLGALFAAAGPGNALRRELLMKLARAANAEFCAELLRPRERNARPGRQLPLPGLADESTPVQAVLRDAKAARQDDLAEALLQRAHLAAARTHTPELDAALARIDLSMLHRAALSDLPALPVRTLPVGPFRSALNAVCSRPVRPGPNAIRATLLRFEGLAALGHTATARAVLDTLARHGVQLPVRGVSPAPAGTDRDAPASTPACAPRPLSRHGLETLARALFAADAT